METCFVIYSPSYSEKIGGVLVLHYLCHYLNQCGYKSVLWHNHKRPPRWNGFRSERFYLRRAVEILRLRERLTSSLLNTPLAKYKDLKNAIVVYPEVVSGNPLGAKKVVRWFLNRPGFFTGSTNYGNNDLCFYYQSEFKGDTDRYQQISKFQFVVYLDEFKKTNFGERSGTCYIVRKGANRSIIHDISDGIVIDDLANEEIAEVFNRSEFCISYDTHTFYSNYAAICGCKSIVIPEPGVNKVDWRPKEEWRYGIAYGEDDLDWAQATYPKMEQFVLEQRHQAQANVSRFAQQCLDYFSAQNSKLSTLNL